MNNYAEWMQFLTEHLMPLSKMLGEDFRKDWVGMENPALNLAGTLPRPDSPKGATGVPSMGAPAAPGMPPGPGVPGARSRPGGGAPLEIYITQDEVVVCAILPGLASREHAAVSLEGHRELTVEAFLQSGSWAEHWLKRERFSGHSSRTVTLPVPVVAEGARARYADGVLEVRLLRLEPGEVGGAGPVLRTE